MDTLENPNLIDVITLQFQQEAALRQILWELTCLEYALALTMLCCMGMCIWGVFDYHREKRRTRREERNAKLPKGQWGV